MSRLARLTMLLAACLALACENNPSGPQAGNLTVTVQDPNSGLDGAMLLTISGPTAPTNVTAAPGDTLWGGPFTQTANTMILTGNIKNGAILTVGVQDVSKASQYSVSLTQVAASSNYALRSVAGYTFTIK